jgi:hypothetical protein
MNIVEETAKELEDFYKYNLKETIEIFLCMLFYPFIFIYETIEYYELKKRIKNEDSKNIN